MLVGFNDRTTGLIPVRHSSPRTAPVSRAEAGGRQNPLMDNGNATAAPYLERAAQLKEILKRIDASKPDITAERRAAAKQKIVAIRKQLEMLRLTLAGDPQSTAQQAASLARDLAAAANEYAAAAGTDGDGAGASSPVSQPAQIEVTAANVAAAGEHPISAAAVDLVRIAQEADGESSTIPQGNGQPAQWVGRLAPSTAAAKLAGSKCAERSNRQREDDDFILLARMTLTSLRSLMRQAAADLAGKAGRAARHDSANGDAALHVAEAGLQSILDASVQQR